MVVHSHQCDTGGSDEKCSGLYVLESERNLGVISSHCPSSLTIPVASALLIDMEPRILFCILKSEHWRRVHFSL